MQYREEKRIQTPMVDIKERERERERERGREGEREKERETGGLGREVGSTE